MFSDIDGVRHYIYVNKVISATPYVKAVNQPSNKREFLLVCRRQGGLQDVK